MELDEDDKPVGRVLSRREMLALLGGTGAAMFVTMGVGVPSLSALLTPTVTATATALPACVVKPALTEGPYFVEELLKRSDIRVEPSTGDVVEGALLELVFRVQEFSNSVCKPLVGAQVDVWHCDAAGQYSDVNDRTFDTTGMKFLRGYQITDALGEVKFTTIYPGWYDGRAVHIHFKVRTDPESDAGYEFTSQLFFDDLYTDVVYEQEPYAAKGIRTLLNDEDGIFSQSEDLLTLVVEETEEGYKAIFDIALDLSVDTSAAGAMGPGNMGGGRPSNRPTATPGS